MEIIELWFQISGTTGTSTNRHWKENTLMRVIKTRRDTCGTSEYSIVHGRAGDPADNADA
jgi:hypothetical protein